MKFIRPILLATLAAAIAFPVGAFAAKADRKNRKEKTPAVAFETIDKSKDGFATREEYVEAMKTTLGEDVAKTRFASLDKNSDGKLSKEEFDSGNAESQKKRRKKNAN